MKLTGAAILVSRGSWSCRRPRQLILIVRQLEMNMGNKRSRELTKPKERGKPCTCDTFALTLDCEETVLIISLSTDLPVNTRVAITAQRLFSETGGHQWYWTCIEDSFPVTKQDDGLNGLLLRLTNDELDTKGLHMYRHLKREMKVVIGSMPSNDLEVSVEAPTTPHRFGLCNRRLTGKAVTVRPSGHSLERSARVVVPTSGAVMKQLGF
jgi:hypothetical protein